MGCPMVIVLYAAKLCCPSLTLNIILPHQASSCFMLKRSQLDLLGYGTVLHGTDSQHHPEDLQLDHAPDIFLIEEDIE